jgi:hypothetical protein
LQGPPGKDVGHKKLWIALGIIGAAAATGIVLALTHEHGRIDSGNKPAIPGCIPSAGFPCPVN